MILRLRSGQMLVEIVLAIAVAALVLVGLAQLSTRSLNTSDFSRSKSQADAYAQGSGEWIRNQRSSLGWTAFYASPVCGPSCGDLGNGYTRNAAFTKDAGPPEKVTVTVTVSWVGSGKTFNVKQTAVFNQY